MDQAYNTGFDMTQIAVQIPTSSKQSTGESASKAGQFKELLQQKKEEVVGVLQQRVSRPNAQPEDADEEAEKLLEFAREFLASQFMSTDLIGVLPSPMSESPETTAAVNGAESPEPALEMAVYAEGESAALLQSAIAGDEFSDSVQQIASDEAPVLEQQTVVGKEDFAIQQPEVGGQESVFGQTVDATPVQQPVVNDESSILAQQIVADQEVFASVQQIEVGSQEPVFRQMVDAATSVQQPVANDEASVLAQQIVADQEVFASVQQIEASGQGQMVDAATFVQQPVANDEASVLAQQITANGENLVSTQPNVSENPIDSDISLKAEQPDSENFLPELAVVVEEPQNLQKGEELSFQQESSMMNEHSKKEEPNPSVSVETPLFREVRTIPIKVAETEMPSETFEAGSIEEQVGDKLLTAIQSGESKVEIKLTPEFLGNVTIEISQDSSEALHIVLKAESLHTQKLLEKHIPSLQATLADHGDQTVQVEIQHQQENQQTDNQQNFYEGQSKDHGQHQQQHKQRAQQDSDFLHQLRLGLIPMEEIS